MYTKALRRTALTMSGLITVLTTLVALVMTWFGLAIFWRESSASQEGPAVVE